jgi:hypothetical protein
MYNFETLSLDVTKKQKLGSYEIKLLDVKEVKLKKMNVEYYTRRNAIGHSI